MRRNSGRWPETLLALGYYQYWVLRDYGLAKNHVRSRYKMYQAAARSERHSDELPDAKETGMKALPTSNKASSSIHVTIWSYLWTPRELQRCSTIAGCAKALRASARYITPNNPDVIVFKASLYQAQGNLQQAAGLLSEIPGQKSFEVIFNTKINQLRLERNYGEAIGLLQARIRLNSSLLLSSKRPFISWTLLLCSALGVRWRKGHG